MRQPPLEEPPPEPPRTKIRIKLADGKERRIQHMSAITFWSADGWPLKLKYNKALADAFADLGRPEQVRQVFVDFQKHLYASAGDRARL